MVLLLDLLIIPQNIAKGFHYKQKLNYTLLKYLLLSLHVDSHALIKFETEGTTSVIPLSGVVHKPLNYGDH